MNKKILQILLVCGIGFVSVGCQNNATLEKVKNKISSFKSKKSESKKEVVQTQDGRPAWVSNPNLDGNVGAVSIVSKKKIKNKKKLYFIAKMKARAAFEARKGTTVDSTAKRKASYDGKMSYSEKVKISSSHIQTDDLVVKETYEDKDYFYMWMVLKK